MEFVIKPDVRTTSDAPIHRTILGIIVDKPESETPKNKRIQAGAHFTNPIPDGSADVGQRKGSWKSISCFPGIPTKKLADKDVYVHWLTHTWMVQNFYQTEKLPTGSKSHVATYVGWNSSAIASASFWKLRRNNPDVINSARIRDQFLECVKRDPCTTDEMRLAANRYLEMSTKFAEDVDHPFWEYEDLTYFHSKIQTDYGLAPVFYVYLRELMFDPPSFLYTTFNIIYKTLFDELDQANRWVMAAQQSDNGTSRKNDCEKPDTCKCSQVYHFYISQNRLPPINLHPHDLPNLSKLLTTLSPDHHRLIIECSDACGCSANCPRRRLQQGQTKRLVVFYEDDGKEKFGLRAAEEIKIGEFVVEYTGHVKKMKMNGEKKKKMEVNVVGKDLMVDASEMGNIARFITTSPNPTAMLIETHSRILEADPLIPRLSVYALKDIAIGERITIPEE